MRSFSVKAIAYACSPSALHPFLKRIEASDIGLRMARGMFWSMAGAVISRALMLLATILVARILGKTGYGELGMIQSTVGMFGVFAGFGLGLTATKYVAELRESDPRRLGRILSMSTLVACYTGGLMALALLLFAPWLAEYTINAPHLVSQLRISAVVLFLSAVNGAQTGALSGFESFKVIAKINLFVGIISFFFLFFGTLYGGLNGAIWALALNLLCNLILNHIALRRERIRHNVPIIFSGCFKEWSVLWSFSLPAALSSMMFGPVKWVCVALLVNQPGGYEEMGIFNVANQWVTAILFLPGLLARVVLPLLSSLNNQFTHQNYIKTFKYNIYLNGIIASCIVVPVVIFAPLIMLSYGQEFHDGIYLLRIMSISAILVSINSVVGSALASKSKMWIGFLFNGMWSFLLVGFSMLFLKIGYGAIALAFATLIAYLAHTCWQFFYLKKLNKFI